LAALQTGNPNPLRLLGHLCGSRTHEKLLHSRFTQFRIQGEWFSRAISADIQSMLHYRSVAAWLSGQTPLPAHDPVARDSKFHQTNPL
jgi:hypothetical protein